MPYHIQDHDDGKTSAERWGIGLPPEDFPVGSVFDSGEALQFIDWEPVIDLISRVVAALYEGNDG